MRFDHLADPDPPVVGADTRRAVARRAGRLIRRRRRARRATTSVVVLVVLGVAAVVAGGRQRPVELDLATPNTGRALVSEGAVEGTVTDQVGAVGGVLVELIDPGAVVTVDPTAASGADPVPPGFGWRIVARAMTDAAGRYRFEGVAPGTYAVRFEDQFDEMAGKVRHQPTFLGGADDLGRAQQIRVPAGAGGAAVRADQRLELSPNHGLRGSVREARRSYPVRNVTVRLYADGQLVRQALTDDQGRYDLGGLRPGSYQVALVDEASRAGGRYPSQWAQGGAAVVMPEDRDVVVDAVLTPPR